MVHIQPFYFKHLPLNLSRLFNGVSSTHLCFSVFIGCVNGVDEAGQDMPISLWRLCNSVLLVGFLLFCSVYQTWLTYGKDSIRHIDDMLAPDKAQKGSRLLITFPITIRYTCMSLAIL